MYSLKEAISLIAQFVFFCFFLLLLYSLSLMDLDRYASLEYRTILTIYRTHTIPCRYESVKISGLRIAAGPLCLTFRVTKVAVFVCANVSECFSCRYTRACPESR